MKPTAWAFLVVSSEAQAETLQHQREWAEQTTREQGWRRVRQFEGVSTGRTGPRRLLRDLLVELRALAAEARPAWVLMIRLDRVGRGAIVETQLAVHELRELGVRVWTREDREVRIETAMEQMFVAMKAAVATQENEVRRDKATAVYRRKRAAGLAVGNKRPYGLAIAPGGRDIALKSHAPAIREAFRMRAAGAGYHLIGQRLQEIAPPQVFKNGREQVVRWTQNRVLRLLENRSYVGTIVDEATFARAQRARERLGRSKDADARASHPWPLSGALRCYCGRAMIGLLCGPRDRRLRYYGCRATWNHDGSVRLVRAEALEDAFTEMLRKLRASPDGANRWRKRAAATTSPKMVERGLREARSRVADLDRQRAKVWELHAAGRVRDEDVQHRLDALAAQRAQAQDAIARLEQERALLSAAVRRDRDVDELLRTAPTLFASAPIEGRKKIARAVAMTFGGFYVAESGKIERGSPEDAGRQRRRTAAGS